MLHHYVLSSSVIFGCISELFSVSALIDVRLEPAGNARTEGYGRFVHVYMVVIKS